MAQLFIVEDEVHAEQRGSYRSMSDAVAELRRLAAIPWDQEPNRAPCTNWRNCHRDYVVVEYDDSGTPWEELRQVSGFDISARAFSGTASRRIAT